MVVMKGTEGMRKVVAVSKIEIALNIAAILNLKWTFGSTGDSGGPIDQHPVRGESRPHGSRSINTNPYPNAIGLHGSGWNGNSDLPG